jgi:MerR family transcriptional regulator, copper efflux regulator
VEPNSSTNRPLRSGELARIAGVSADTLRYYERLRLLPTAPRSASGYRLFPPESIVRVQLIRSALSIGFSTRELREILGERDRGGAPCHRVRSLVGEKLTALEARLRDLKSLRRELRSTLVEWDALLCKSPRGKQVRLLERFGLSHPTRQVRNALSRGNQKRERQK